MNSIAPIQSITQAYTNSPLVKGTPLEEGMRAIYDTSNSLSAFEADATCIGIRLDNSGGCTRLLMSNDGEPIPPDAAREIFVPFFTTKKKGSGIGLSLARQMMMAQGGDLILADTPQPGYHTTFIMVF